MVFSFQAEFNLKANQASAQKLFCSAPIFSSATVTTFGKRCGIGWVFLAKSSMFINVSTATKKIILRNNMVYSLRTTMRTEKVINALQKTFISIPNYLPCPFIRYFLMFMPKAEGRHVRKLYAYTCHGKYILRNWTQLVMNGHHEKTLTYKLFPPFRETPKDLRKIEHKAHAFS